MPHVRAQVTVDTALRLSDLGILDADTAAACGVGVEHRRSNRKNISIARRRSVAVLDEHVGPKG